MTGGVLLLALGMWTLPAQAQDTTAQDTTAQDTTAQDTTTPAAITAPSTVNPDAPAPAASNNQLMVPDSPDQVQVDTKQTPDFHAFWQRFQAASKKNNRKALQGMTHLPFDLNTTSYDAAHFKDLAAQIYDPKARDCIAKETPVHDQDNYEVFCGETVYVFGTDPTLPPGTANAADGSGWRLLEIGAND